MKYLHLTILEPFEKSGIDTEKVVQSGDGEKRWRSKADVTNNN